GDVDGLEVREGRLPARASPDRRTLRGPVWIAGYVRVHGGRAIRAPRPTRLPGHGRLRRPHLPVAHPRLCQLPLSQGLVLPLAAAGALPTSRAGPRLAPLRNRDLRPVRKGERMKISVIGLGKLGSPMAACFAAKGFTTIGVDLNETFVEAIN